MKIDFRRLGRKALGIIKEVGLQADEEQVAAFLVGGCVRDVLMGKRSGDIDIVCEGDAIRFVKKFSAKRKIPVRVYPEFGTASVELSSGQWVDFSTARQERYPSPGALPVTRPSRLYDDLARRDFSINALVASINRREFGRVTDFFNGLEDLKAGKIRILHPESFRDDPTRILRAVRFEQRFEFRLERGTLRYLKEALEKKYVKRVNPPRYFAEFRKILKEAEPVRYLKRLNDLGGLGFICEKTHWPWREMRRLERNIQKLRKEAIYKNTQWDTVYLMALLQHQKVRVIESFVSKVNLPKRERIALLQLSELPEIVPALRTEKIQASEVCEVLRGIQLEMLMFLRAQYCQKEMARKIDCFFSDWQHVELAISGRDLVHMGAPSGKRIGKILKILLQMKIDGSISTKKEELKQAKHLLAEGF